MRCGELVCQPVVIVVKRQKIGNYVGRTYIIPIAFDVTHCYSNRPRGAMAEVTSTLNEVVFGVESREKGFEPSE